MKKRLLILSVATVSMLAASAFAAETEEKAGDTKVEKKTTLMGTKKTTVKSKSKSKAADGSEVDHTYTDETKVHKNGKVEREAKENVEVTPPDKK